jgi:hypothetical protein
MFIDVAPSRACFDVRFDCTGRIGLHSAAQDAAAWRRADIGPAIQIRPCRQRALRPMDIVSAGLTLPRRTAIVAIFPELSREFVE